MILAAAVAGCNRLIDLEVYSRDSASAHIHLPEFTNNVGVTTAPADAVHIELNERDVLSIAGVSLSRDQMTVILKRIRAARGNVPVFIWADERAQPSAIILTIDLAKACGFSEFWTVAKAEDDKIMAYRND